MNIQRIRLFSVALLLGVCGLALANDRPYTEGSVIEVSYIRTKPGMFEEYLKWVATQRKALMEEMKKAGIILNYGIYAAAPRNPQDPDVILTVEYKNMAAFDNLQDKVDPIDAKVFGSIQASEQANIDRGKLRDVLGSELVRELRLK
jgi:hypothetical protein